METLAAEPVSVVFVDDHPVFREGLHAVLSADPSLRVVGQAATLDEAIEMMGQMAIDLAIVDILLAQGDGIQVTRKLRERCADAKVLGLSVLTEPTRVAELLRAGASGFALKTQPVPELLEAVHATLQGDRYVTPSLRGELAPLLDGQQKLPLERLTARERQVFRLLVSGHSNTTAATELGIAARTVETHRQRILKKLGAHSIAELVRLAARWGALG